VDPGNLLASGSIAGVPIIGLPGCARSPRLNGVDLILPRLLAGMEISADILLGLGVGGLLSDIPERPQPREQHDVDMDEHKTTTAEPVVSAIVLAAGKSRRMGRSNKLLEDIHGKPMIRRVASTAMDALPGHVTVVTGFEADRVRDALDGLDVVLTHNPQFTNGLSTSVKTGIGSLSDDTDGALVILGDMPGIDVDIINRLTNAFRDSGGRAICVPVHDGKKGNPVLWPREFFPDILDLTGDAGARRMLDQFKDRVVEVAVDQAGILMDVDTPEDLNALNSGD
ncbi:MAG: NTP transferase domain-containing protein, partial [Rhodospirillaceae bacterium]|nr:NTP transferase domain-containing protein [Rhodospirillaceae bacterium]